ncbi:MAG: hypothetical protein HZB72_08990 [Burkholderiales bacterium]|nr:hypothetical protein [Burkholderiales bacterium]
MVEDSARWPKRLFLPLGPCSLSVALAKDLWWMHQGSGRMISLVRLSVWRPNGQRGWVVSLVVLNLKLMVGKV